MVRRNPRTSPDAPTDTTTHKPTTHTPTGLRNSPTYLKYLGWAVAAAIVLFAYLNIAPYEQAVRILFSSSEVSGLAAFILNLPGIGLMVSGALNLLSWLAGAVLWFVLQTLELLPVLLFNNRRALKGVIKQSTGDDTFKISPNDDPALANLKRVYNRLPYRIVRQFRQFALFAYVVDLCICLTVYPPVDGGISKMMLIITTGAFQLINWGNVLMLLVTLFAVEVLVTIAFMVADLRATLAKGEVND